jgi:hypothetical protein
MALALTGSMGQVRPVPKLRETSSILGDFRSFRRSSCGCFGLSVLVQDSVIDRCEDGEALGGRLGALNTINTCWRRRTRSQIETRVERGHRVA